MNIVLKAIEAAGGATALARAVGVVPMAVQQWKKRGVPPERCLLVEAATHGAVTRYDLRPDIFGPAPDVKREAA